MTYRSDPLFHRRDWEDHIPSYGKRYYAEIEHDGLRTHRIIQGAEKSLLNRKVQSQYEQWTNTWHTIQVRRKQQALRRPNQQLADELTEDAKAELLQVKNLLLHTLGVHDPVDWDELKATERFPEPSPEIGYASEIRKVGKPYHPVDKKAPNPPDETKFEPQLDFFDHVFKFLGNKKRRIAQQRRERAYQNYHNRQQEVEAENALLLSNYQDRLSRAEQQIAQLQKQCEMTLQSWRQAAENYYAEQRAYNDWVKVLQNNYQAGEANAIMEYCELVLNRSVYPETFPKDFDLEYRPTDKLLVVDYVLPAPEQLPKLREVKYIPTQNELEEYYLSDVQVAELYESAMYQIALRTLHELFEADQIGALQRIAFNGWVKSPEEPSGRRSNTCKVSIVINREEFEAINLSDIDPNNWSWVKYYTPIQTVAQIDRNDKRFVSSLWQSPKQRRSAS